METKAFHLGDILSITTGHLVSPRHMDGVYDILNFMTGESLFTHQLPRVGLEAKPVLLKQHPELVGITGEEVTAGNWQTWLAEMVTKHGEFLSVEKMRTEDHERIDPISELAEKVHPAAIIPVIL